MVGDVDFKMDEDTVGDECDGGSDLENDGDGDPCSPNSASDSDSISIEGSIDEGGKKKKKKKKKRKKKAKEEGTANGVPLAAEDSDMLPPEVAESRYSAALESIRSDDDLCLWVQLSRCRLSDKKLKKLADALMDNSTVMSIDLSHNWLSDEGVQKLTNVLATGAAPDLIALDVRWNKLSENGRGACAMLTKVRKQLKIEYKEDLPAGSGSSDSVDVYDGMPLGRQSWAGGRDAVSGWEADSGGRSAAQMKAQAAVKAGNAQKTIDACLALLKDATRQAGGSQGGSCHLSSSAVTSLALSLAELCEGVVSELKEEQHKTYAANSVIALPKTLRVVVASLPLLFTALSMDPPHVPRQHSPASTASSPPAPPPAAAGRHRLALADLLYRLLLACNRCVEEEVVAAMEGQQGQGGVPAVLPGWLFRFPYCSPLHNVVTRIIKVVCSRPITRLAALLMDGKEGLIARLAEAGTASWQLPMCERPGYLGHVVLLSRWLQNDAAKQHRVIHKRLASSETWCQYSATDGPLSQLLAEQDGVLGGEKPVRQAQMQEAYFESDQAEEADELEKLCKLYLERANGGFKAGR